MPKTINKVPQAVRDMHTAIKSKTRNYYWWKHRKTLEEQEKINNLQIISMDDLSVILGDFLETQFKGFDKKALKKALVSNWMPSGYLNTDDGN